MKTLLRVCSLLVMLCGVSLGQGITIPLNTTIPQKTTLFSANGVSLLGSCNTNSGASSATNCTTNSGGNAGDLLVAFSKITNVSGTGTLAITSAQCANWFWLEPVDPNGSGGAMNSGAEGCLLTSSVTPNVIATWSGTTGTSPQLTVQILHASTGWNTPVLDAVITSVNTTASTNCATGSINTTNANDFIYANCASNGTVVWNSLTGFTALRNANSLGNYGKLVAAGGAQSQTISMGSSVASTGGIFGLQTATNLSCGAAANNCSYIQGNSSSGQTGQFDHITLNSVVNGDTLIYFVVHNNYSGTGTITMSDATGLNIWHDCNEGVTPALSITVNDTTHLSAAYSMHCFWTPVGLSTNAAVVGQPTATDCSVSCSYVGGIFIELRGTFNLDSFATSASGVTSGSGSNNATCGTMTTTRTNDLIVNYANANAGAPGTMTAGTSPITFALGSIATQANGVPETAIWTSSGSITPAITFANSGSAYGDMCLAFY